MAFVGYARMSWDALWAFASRDGITSLCELAHRTGITHRTFCRWKRQGGVPEPSADRVAVALRVMPHDVWGEEYELFERAAIAALEAADEAKSWADFVASLERSA